SRVDLWPAKDCLEFAKISDRAFATPPDAVKRFLGCEFARPLDEAFSVFEAEPFESRLLFQSHYARLSNGTDVIVKLIHPEVESQLFCDIDLLPLLRDSFIGSGVSASGFNSAVTDFCHGVHQQMDFVNEARAFA